MSTLGLGQSKPAVVSFVVAALASVGALTLGVRAASHVAGERSLPPSSDEVALGPSARVDAHGARVPVGRADRELSIGLRALGRPGAMSDMATVVPVLADGEARLGRAPGVVEWWRPVPSGLEQGVTIDTRPSGDGPLVLEMTAGDGARAERVSDDELALRDVETGAVLASYAHLVVLDARGERVPARLLADAGRIRVEVEDRGARYPLVVDPIVAVEEATLAAPAAGEDDVLGASVAISADGTRILVGAYGADPGGLLDAGAAYVFLRSGTSWTLEATLLAGNRAADDGFGASVALTPDATRALVGAYRDDLSIENDVGSARVFVRTGTTWTEEATLEPSMPGFEDAFGVSAALSADGTRAFIGAPYDNTTSGGVDGGSVRVYLRSGSSWAEEGTLSSPDLEAELGWGLAVSAAGDRAAVGAPHAGVGGAARAGVVRVYRRTGTSWAEEALLPPGPGQVDRFLGQSVAMTPDGTRVLAGAPYENVGFEFEAGAAHMYLRSGASWVAEALLTNPGGIAQDHVGTAVALTASGSRALVGADFAYIAALDSGAAYLFLRRPSGWITDARLLPAAIADGDAFGSAAALAADGSRAVVGAYLDNVGGVLNSGSATVFRFAPAGQACTDPSDCGSGECVDGVCCDLSCGGGALDDCEACTTAMTGRPDGTCAPIVAGTECRAVATLCDRAEVCDGTSRACPANTAAPSGTPCRLSTGACDAQEVCDGTSPSCPGDVLSSPGVVCRSPAGDCDIAETCTGSSSACPADAVVGLGVPCRIAMGTCDVPEACTGASAVCPADVFAAADVVCDATVAGDCDVPDVCTGMSADCPPAFRVDVECRGSAGGCDTAEVCTGTTVNCPLDALLPTGVVCRAPTDASCDPAEACDGVAATCPTDVTMCGGPDAGPALDGGALADAGMVARDGGPSADAGADAGVAPVLVNRCSCRVAGARSGAGATTLFAVFGLVLAARRARRRGRG